MLFNYYHVIVMWKKNPSLTDFGWSFWLLSIDAKVRAQRWLSYSFGNILNKIRISEALCNFGFNWFFWTNLIYWPNVYGCIPGVACQYSVAYVFFPVGLWNFKLDGQKAITLSICTWFLKNRVWNFFKKSSWTNLIFRLFRTRFLQSTHCVVHRQ